MTNHLSIRHPKNAKFHYCKFNVSTKLATETLIPRLRAAFEIEMYRAHIATQNQRTIIELQLNARKARILKQAFLYHLRIFENQN